MDKQSKSLLAKLMASEDIHVEYSNTAPTASFDTENRVLRVPIFDGEMSVDATDLMLGHEVGHALYTPQGAILEVLEKGGVYKGFVNIVEDARIEKMIQSKFPGLKRIFKDAYVELMDKDFFGTKGKDLNSYNFIDRLNLHFKAGLRAGVEFSDEEMVYVERMNNLRTWGEVITLSDDLFDYCKKNEDKETEEPATVLDAGDVEENDGEMSSDMPMDSTNASSDDEDDSDDEDGKNDSPGNQSESDDQGEEEGDGESGAGEDSADDEVEEAEEGDSEGNSTGNKSSENSSSSIASQTQERFEERMQDSVDTSKSILDLTIPKVDLKEIIISPDKVHALIDQQIAQYPEQRSIAASREEWNKFSSEQKSIVTYMVKEFEMRKAADEHKRTSVATTGILNPNRLHAYKFSEDIFLKNAVVADGKNHGFIMYIDWSGSMRPCMSNTIRQLMLLAMFCKKANIPFDAFAFTNRFGNPDLGRAGRNVYYEHSKPKELLISHSFKLLHLISSKVKSLQFTKMMTYLMYMDKEFSDGSYSSDLPDCLQLGGTPLNETIIAAMEMVPAFRKMYRTQIVNVVFLTDGVGHQLNNYTQDDGSMGHDHYSHKVYITDPVSKMKKLIEYGSGQTVVLMEMLKTRDCRLAGFYVSTLAKRNAMIDFRAIGKMGISYEEIDKWWKDFLKAGWGQLDSKGYDTFYVLNGREMKTDKDELVITDDMSQAKMRNAFIKNRKSNLNSKKMLSAFCEFVS